MLSGNKIDVNQQNKSKPYFRNGTCAIGEAGQNFGKTGKNGGKASPPCHPNSIIFKKTAKQ